MKVHTLVAVTNPRFFRSCTFCFETFRRGFPKAELNVWIQSNSHDSQGVAARANSAGARSITQLHTTVPHAEWIRSVLMSHNSDEPLIFIDPDTYWWKSCEDFRFQFDTLMAGYYIPKIWNDFSKCISMPRLHTSHLWFPDVKRLLHRIREAYPLSFDRLGECCPCEPFLPDVKFVRGKGATFWDACSNLFNMIPETWAFNATQIDCFEHLGSASAFDVMVSRFDGGKELFELLHTQGLDQPELLKKHLWPQVNSYYRRKAAEAQVVDCGIEPV